MKQAAPTPSETPRLRLWPGVLLALLLVGARFGLPLVSSDLSMPAMMASLGFAAAILLWWLFFSRARIVDRVLAPVLIAASALVVRPFLDESMETAGYGQLYWVFSLPLLCVALVVWASFFGGRSPAGRRIAMAVVLLLTAGAWTAVRFDGTDGGFDADLSLRWTKTAEDRLVAAGDSAPAVSEGVASIDTGGGWSAFRGPERDSRISNLRIATNWEASPPVEMWRRSIGPGWGSFSVRGDLLYTQEQRGDEEVVATYRVSNGEPVWKHRDRVRFWEAIGGAGPRATPTLAGNIAYALGATGILNALDAENGSLVWSRNTVEDTGAVIPDWGVSGSPMVLGDTVYVAASGALAAYDAATGTPRWIGEPTSGESYSSPHLFKTEESQQIVLLDSEGVKAVDPSDGSPLWNHSWPGAPIVQPAFTDNGDILVSASEQSGLRRLAVTGSAAAGWSAQEQWTSIRLKPYFNDFVVHEGYAYGFDGRILAAMDLVDGKRVWKGGRYGNGQLVLLADQGLLLVLSEDGDLALVSATPDGFEELSLVPALEGKTWNHPVVVGRVLLIRNGVEMAAFRLPEQTT